MAEDRTERPSYPFPLPPDLLDDAWDEERDESRVSPFAVLTHLFRHARWIVGLPLVVFILVAAYMGTRDHDYVAISKFLPATADFSGSDGGVFSQLSRLVGGRRGGPGSNFYAFLVPTTAFLREVAASEFEFTRTNDNGEPETVRGSLADIYGVPPSTEEAEIRTSLSILRGMVNSDHDVGTDFVVVRVTAPWKDLAVAVNNRVLEVVNDFNLEQRQTQAASERAFIEERMAEVQAELEEAEAAMVQFLETNQRYEQSPRLRFEALRLQSEVDLKRRLYSDLAQSYEQARITEVRNTPVVTIVERPEQTVYQPKGGNDPIRFGLMAAVVVLLLTLAFFGMRAFLVRQSEVHPDDYAEFRRTARASIPKVVRSRWRDGANGGGPAGGDSPGGAGRVARSAGEPS